MLSFVEKYKLNVYSQNGEDGIIAECLMRINPSLEYAIEFGGADGYYCSNTATLRELGWHVDMYDINPGSELVIKAEVTPDNVNQLLRPCSVLSIDCDGPDYTIWGAYNGKPDIVIIEVNSSIRPPRTHYTKADGASYMSMLTLGISKGYFLLAHTGNMIFVLNKHRELFPEITGNGIDNWEEYFKMDWV